MRKSELTREKQRLLWEVKNDNEKFVPSESDKEAIRKNIEEIECLKIQSP